VQFLYSTQSHLVLLNPAKSASTSNTIITSRRVLVDLPVNLNQHSGISCLAMTTKKILTVTMKLNFSEQGTGLPVILIHGMFGSLSNLGNLARALVSHHRVISVDLRNHGDSPHEQQMDIEVMARDIVELLDALNIESATLVGHSLGGKVAMQVAMNQPDRVACLVVADISPVDYPEQNNHQVVRALQEVTKQILVSRQQADAILADNQIDAPTRAFLLKNLRRSSAGHFELKLNVDSIVANYGNKLVLAPTGDRFLGPALFIKGENSAYIQDKHKAVIKDLFPKSHLDVVEGVGHWLHAEKPEVFNSLVLRFLSANL
jgi:esterase